jgi:hypothetical protein
MDSKSLALFIPILGIIFGTAMWIGIIWLVVRYRFKRDALVFDTAAKLAEKGHPVPKELFQSITRPRSDLRTGLVLIMLGIGLAITLWDLDIPWTFGLIPFLVGAGYLIVWFTEKTNRTTQDSSDNSVL